jgi:hypothetical protein
VWKPPGLLAEVPRRHQLLEHARRPELLAAEPVVEHLQDPEADVEPDEVGQLERTHRVVEAHLRARVDVVGRAEALLVGPHRLGQERHEDPVDDEPRPIGGGDDLLAHLGGESTDRGLRLVARGRAADQLDERHHRDRAEEVHPDEPGAPFR